MCSSGMYNTIVLAEVQSSIGVGPDSVGLKLHRVVAIESCNEAVHFSRLSDYSPNLRVAARGVLGFSLIFAS
jgi:hypothetical protein